ncbi:hypothetical protein [Croceivirga sp. JEA036]|uniref:hypothetical protein n=1 Tax=Croceivirga sp. JEA036 TaxID=2721162 RepID=UPI001439D089|nr:hypothetical protein [Croceivirga sp. JEA036]NJB36006.1 hypothetical protein [Croceivirga sp. JEA036]
MKYGIGTLFVVICFLIISCKNNTSKTEETIPEAPEIEEKHLTLPEKIAVAHGFENWKTIDQLAFTFNVDRNEKHFQRSWIWNIKQNTVTHINGTDSLTYNRKSMDSVAYKTNAGFINDKFWLLAPFNLVWDRKNYTYTHKVLDTTPIGKHPMQKLTVVYGNKGGYTPGDAYDFYFGDDLIIREWTFREGNQEKPSMSTTWENYKEQNGIKIAQEYKGASKDFKLYFDGIKVNGTALDE